MSECVHHWLLDAPSPDTPVVTGICKKCGDARAWDNSKNKHYYIYGGWMDDYQERSVQKDVLNPHTARSIWG